MLGSELQQNEMTADSFIVAGAELKRFLADPLVWADGTHWDDTLILVDGCNAEKEGIDLEEIADAASVVVECGYLIDPPPGVPDDLIEAITWWRSKQATVCYFVTVPRDGADEFERQLGAMGAKFSRADADAHAPSAQPLSRAGDRAAQRAS